MSGRRYHPANSGLWTAPPCDRGVSASVAPSAPSHQAPQTCDGPNALLGPRAERSGTSSNPVPTRRPCGGALIFRFGFAAPQCLACGLFTVTTFINPDRNLSTTREAARPSEVNGFSVSSACVSKPEVASR